jgi:fused signal recognition particle receptor
VKRTGTTDSKEVTNLLKNVISNILEGDNSLLLKQNTAVPAIILVIGVNGAGKTTTIGKLAYNLKKSGKKVTIVAADTFRAAAIEQLDEWAKRAGVDIIKRTEGSDPASVVYDGLDSAIARKSDVALIDTAGRLHNKAHLMEELRKISRIIQKRLPETPIETLLVLDSTTGQNAVNQAKLFGEVADITGIVLAKLDGTAKGGIVIPIKNELGIPVKLVGVGEKIDDLIEFVPKDYANSLFEK